MEFSWNPNTKCIEKPQSSVSMCTLFLVFPLFQKYLNSQVKMKKIDKECCLPPLPFKISLRNTYIHISLNLLGFISLQNACWIFFDLYIPPCVGKLFQFMVFTFLENALNLCIFTHAPVLHSKPQVEFFENLFNLRWKGWRKLCGGKMVCFIEISLFIFCMVCNFSKCDGFMVLWIISIK